MQYISSYNSKLGRITLASDEKGLIGLWFEGQKYYKSGLSDYIQKETDFIKEAKKWLDIYFSGKNPNFTPKLHLEGSEFYFEVWEILRKIPYGKTVTYKDIAIEIAKKRGINKMSAQAVGGAVSHNKISIIIPCHRVIGSNNSLTGYAAGVNIKRKLLNLEGVYLD